MSESIAEISKALIAFHKQCPKIPKLSRNPFLKSKYADLSTILEVVQPILNECDLVVQQHPTASYGLTTIVSHASGEWISSEYPMQPLEAIVEKASGDRSAVKAITPQSIGTVITYQRRYALGAILALNIDDDNDGHVEPTASTAPAGPKKTAQELMQEAAAKVKAASATPVAAAGTPATTPAAPDNQEDGDSTAAQRDRITELYRRLHITPEQQAAILAKRGLSVLRSLSSEQAGKIIASLEGKLPPEPTADQVEGVTAGGSDADKSHSMSSDAPATKDQVAAIKASLIELEQSRPGTTADFIARLNGAGFGKIADMTFDQARKLSQAIDAETVAAFFDSQLATAAAG